MSDKNAQPHVGIDVRLRAYRLGGIASYGAMLLEGLAALPELTGPDRSVRVTAIEHVRGRGAIAHSGPITPTPIASRFVRTPPHHRMEDFALPLELAIGPRLDLLHSPDFIVPLAWRGIAVATVHDLAFLRHPEYLTGESRRYYGRVHRSLKRAERVIAVSDHTRRELLALTDVDPDRVRVVHNALRPEIASQVGAPRDAALEAKALESTGLRRPFILFVSTIEPRKDAETLLHAFRRLLDEGRDLDLALVGSDGWKSESVYATWRALGLEARAHFIGRCDAETLPALYQAAELLAHPARDEGFGLTPLEAMALGTPTIVSDAGALPEVAGDAALRVPPGDVAAWAAAIGRVLDDPALAARLRQAGPERAASFTLERMARGTLAVYREALDDAGIGRRSGDGAGRQREIERRVDNVGREAEIGRRIDGGDGP